jgi:dipeptidyl aminopeptidase/acylaminoacyl peptidase
MNNKNRVSAAIVLISLYTVSLGDTPDIPVENLFGFPAFDQVKLSPDGDFIAMTAPVGDRQRLVILETDKLKPVAGFEVPAKREIYEFWWANEERIVFSLARRLGWLDFPTLTGELYGLNVDGSRKFPLAGNVVKDAAYYTVLDTYPPDREKILVLRKDIRKGSIARSRPSAYLLDIYTEYRGETGTKIGRNRLKEVAFSPLPHGELMADGEGKIRLAYTLDSDGAFKVQHRLADSSDWKPLKSLITPEEAMLGGGDPFIGFGADNENLLYMAVSEQGTSALASLNIKSQETTIIYQHPDFDVEPRNVMLSHDGKEVIGVKFIGDYPENHYFSESEEAKLRQGFDKAFPNQLVRVTSMSEDGRVALVIVIGDTQPETMYLYDAKVGQLRFLMGTHPHLESSQLAYQEPFIIKSPEGFSLHGYLTLPKGKETDLPLVVIPHGGPHGIRDSFLFHPEAQYLANHGFAVLQVNFRGSGGYGREFLEAGVREWGQGMIDDIALTTKWAIQTGVANPKRICIYGGSYGAYAAMMSVIRYPLLYQCAIGVAGVYDLTIMNESDIPFISFGQAYLNHVIGTDETELKLNSPAFRANEIKVPVFIAHGGEDDRAPVQHAYNLRDALEKEGYGYEWMLAEDEGHGFFQLEHRLEFYKHLLKFLEKNI